MDDYEGCFVYNMSVLINKHYICAVKISILT